MNLTVIYVRSKNRSSTRIRLIPEHAESFRKFRKIPRNPKTLNLDYENSSRHDWLFKIIDQSKKTKKRIFNLTYRTTTWKRRMQMKKKNVLAIYAKERNS